MTNFNEKEKKFLGITNNKTLDFFLLLKKMSGGTFVHQLGEDKFMIFKVPTAEELFNPLNDFLRTPSYLQTEAIEFNGSAKNKLWFSYYHAFSLEYLQSPEIRPAVKEDFEVIKGAFSKLLADYGNV